MKQAVMYGAGNIGRGFIGQLFSQSGYEVVFIDVNLQVINQINLDKKYQIKLVTNESQDVIKVENIRAVNGQDENAVAEEIAKAEIMATAVGPAILPRIAPVIAAGLIKRYQNDQDIGSTKAKVLVPSLNIIVCENLLEADKYLRNLVFNNLLTAAGEETANEIIGRTGFVEASIGRMVPVNQSENQMSILDVITEPYSELPVDADGFRGEIPQIKNMKPYPCFEFYIQRKLYLHNMGHAITAYLGRQSNYEYIWQAIGDQQIRQTVLAAMNESAQALAVEHSIPINQIEDYNLDLIARFGNRNLGDTVYRVGRDIKRKLAPGDRLLGAFALCVKHGVKPVNILKGITAAIEFEE